MAGLILYKGMKKYKLIHLYANIVFWDILLKLLCEYMIIFIIFFMSLLCPCSHFFFHTCPVSISEFMFKSVLVFVFSSRWYQEMCLIDRCPHQATTSQYVRDKSDAQQSIEMFLNAALEGCVIGGRDGDNGGRGQGRWGVPEPIVSLPRRE